MRIERFFNKHGASGCYKCKTKNARWKVGLRIDNHGNDMPENAISVLLCSDCVELTEDQLRIFFLG